MHVVKWMYRTVLLALGWALSVQAARAQDDDDDDFLPGRSPEQIQTLFENLDEVIETIGAYAGLAAVLAILLGLALFLRLPRWGAYVMLTIFTLVWLAYFEQHMTGLFWMGMRPDYAELILLGCALASLHMITAALSILPDARLGWMDFVLVIGVAAIWVVLWLSGIPQPGQTPPLLYTVPALALLSHAAAVPSFLRLQGATSGLTRNGAIFALTVTTALAIAILFGELSEELDLVFMLRLVMVAVVVYFVIFFTRFVLALLFQRDQNARLALEAAQREAEKTQALLEAEQNYSRAKETARRHTLRLAEASHDIRQPIASLRSTMDAVAHDQAPETRAQLSAAFDYLDGLAKSYLDTGEAENAPLRTTEDGLEEVHADMIFSTLDRMFRNEAEARGLSFDAKTEYATLHVQPLMLIRILSNLMSNAIKHTRQGRVSLTGEAQTDGFRFTVYNSADLPEGTDGATLFDPFVKGHRSDGSGLGLSIVDNLTKRFGWHLSWSGAPGQGTTFQITVPQS